MQQDSAQKQKSTNAYMQSTQQSSQRRPPSSNTLLQSLHSQTGCSTVPRTNIYRHSSQLAEKQAINDSQSNQSDSKQQNSNSKAHNLISGAFMSPQAHHQVAKRNSGSLGLAKNQFSSGQNLVSQSMQIPGSSIGQSTLSSHNNNVRKPTQQLKQGGNGTSLS